MGFDHHRLIDDVDGLLDRILGVQRSTRMTLRAAFLRYVDLDPFTATMDVLHAACQARGFCSQTASATRDECLDYLLSGGIQPALGPGRVYLYDFPASQAALARIRRDIPDVAERFELYVDGIEIANGYHELREAAELERRMRRDIATRQAAGRHTPDLDQRLVAAHNSGLPACAGVAVGFDRLVMIAGRYRSLQEVLPFPCDTA